MTCRFIGALVALFLASFGYAQNPQTFLRSEPRWFEVIGDSLTSGPGCAVRSLNSGEIMGTIESKSRFLALGVDQDKVALAYQGKIGTVAAASVTEVFPSDQQKVTTEMRLPGTNITKQLDEIRAHHEQARGGGVPLYPSFAAKGTPAAGAAGGAPAAATPAASRGGAKGGGR